ncbi:hypothetical protein JXM67_14000 [candidate division WOR-3 bacterium]|nr:hypothetical protein [candidate division WOR-3 bacterium]
MGLPICIPPGILPDLCYVWAEFNHDSDRNPAYPGFFGQPSVVYRGRIAPGEEVTLEPIGHGHPSGDNGLVYPDLSGLSTALSIIESIRVVSSPF